MKVHGWNPAKLATAYTIKQLRERGVYLGKRCSVGRARAKAQADAAK